ncbi:TadE/TadG family type IV pilus assembly protein [Streptomyces sp. Li-HN-5-11]|uniref:TadE/TadG family type IV pilus assembly protein n=1 Tax=Streptomyces sp. Li-HN-5-11 TaxID=3075432 RepID=UPI0028AD332F|nr:TadE/TadG family type IV pilus assembly protein [Streptomyces sp. Li-HN-5-11]WNM29888.1 TadE/TadG family type IV pilus assembly protein [Streptomyces sp. Li-HN-5-11]
MPRARPRREDRTRRGDRGQVAIEYLGFIPILLLVAMAAIQLGLVAYTAQQAGTAARAGARAASLQQSAQEACGQAVSSWLAGGTTCAAGPGADPHTVTVTATIHIPSIIPAWGDAFGTVQKTATMPLDH